MTPYAPLYLNCFTAPAINVGGYTALSNYGTLIHEADAAKACWLDAACGSVLAYAGLNFLRGTSGNAVAVPGATLRVKLSSCPEVASLP
tara:strand:- start:362 stop:628 length:267 start_codon:yes stop_codon:yes gene_type:complete